VGSPSSVQRQVAFEAFDDFSMSADNPRLLLLAPEDWDALTHAVDLVEVRAARPRIFAKSTSTEVLVMGAIQICALRISRNTVVINDGPLIRGASGRTE
jgi:hypothetical protein